jgi:hypothetical protein
VASLRPHLQIPRRWQSSGAATTALPQLVPWRSELDWRFSCEFPPCPALTVPRSGMGMRCWFQIQYWELHTTRALSHLRLEWRLMERNAVLFAQTGNFLFLSSFLRLLLTLPSFICRFILRPCQYLRVHSVQ